MLKYITALLILMGWTLYVWTTGYVLIRLFNGDIPEPLRGLSFGVPSMWLFLGFLLFLATAWWDEQFGSA